tara:strand:+ start:424 stop:981 length:558 start_codon:yes stop_codon:yes gene_type:complete
MFNIFKKQDKPYQASAFQLYATAMDAARNPVFFEKYDVPDSLQGRFEVLSLYVGMLMLRLSESQSEREEAVDLSQALFDAMFADMDQSLREIGIGDMTIPKRMKHLMKSLNGRLHAYQEGFEQMDKDSGAALKNALRRNLFGTQETVSEESLSVTAQYLQKLKAELDGQAVEMLLSGQVSFPKFE